MKSMQFHTSMIILHRPPRHLFTNPDISTSEDVEICYESLQAILRLMRSYSRLFRYDELPLDFVHTLSVAASTVLMRRWLDGDVKQMEREMGQVLQAMLDVRETWPSVDEIEKSVRRVVESGKPAEAASEIDAIMDVGFMAGLTAPNEGDNWSIQPDYYDDGMFDATLGPILTDEDLGGVADQSGHLLVSSINPDV